MLNDELVIAIGEVFGPDRLLVLYYCTSQIDTFCCTAVDRYACEAQGCLAVGIVYDRRAYMDV
jgi:hypothetical protein